MELTIWKFKLETTDIQKLRMPKGSEILTVQLQKGIPYLWALVNPNEVVIDYETRIIEIFGTGNPIKWTTNRKYISSYQLYEGSFVGHVFELIK